MTSARVPAREDVGRAGTSWQRPLVSDRISFRWSAVLRARAQCWARSRMMHPAKQRLSARPSKSCSVRQARNQPECCPAALPGSWTHMLYSTKEGCTSSAVPVNSPKSARVPRRRIRSLLPSSKLRMRHLFRKSPTTWRSAVRRTERVPVPPSKRLAWSSCGQRERSRCSPRGGDERTSSRMGDVRDRSDPQSRDTVRLGVVYFAGGCTSRAAAEGPDISDPQSQDTVRLGVVYFASGCTSWADAEGPDISDSQSREKMRLGVVYFAGGCTSCADAVGPDQSE